MQHKPVRTDRATGRPECSAAEAGISLCSRCTAMCRSSSQAQRGRGRGSQGSRGWHPGSIERLAAGRLFRRAHCILEGLECRDTDDVRLNAGHPHLQQPCCLTDQGASAASACLMICPALLGAGHLTAGFLCGEVRKPAPSACGFDEWSTTHALQACRAPFCLPAAQTSAMYKTQKAHSSAAHVHRVQDGTEGLRVQSAISLAAVSSPSWHSRAADQGQAHPDCRWSLPAR